MPSFIMARSDSRETGADDRKRKRAMASDRKSPVKEKAAGVMSRPGTGEKPATYTMFPAKGTSAPISSRRVCIEYRWGNRNTARASITIAAIMRR